ncbi:anhydro-N-acetylmuramic acid kinase AnmK [Streptococcus catagoni]|uniref:anhydro-N-acetylmuramic acid kinase AnmK n=1 Tax=Streptococcus catagoni TaxID=2654874 RepID=UPI00140E1E78|nr:anhydro-N-acetylmuramic acid kinase AnmK [Streptococcus catagoni]
MKAVGIMSGTSLDGVDVVLCDIEGMNSDTKIEELNFSTFPFPKSLKVRLKNILLKKESKLDDLCSINFELGQFFSDCVIQLCNKANIETDQLGFIASHGQTFFHLPEDTNDFIKSTLQLGEPSVIAENCGCPVISNFRVRDMSVGGQGAPLVPFSEYLLYNSSTHGISLLNIGGIGNITVIPKNSESKDVYAFDTGPGNMMINEAMHLLFGKEFDEDGKTAKIGNIIPKLKMELENHFYLSIAPPKTTGREMFGDDFTGKLIKKYKEHKKADIIATLTWFTAFSIYSNYNQYIKPYTEISELIVGGGGSHNITLMNWLKYYLKDIDVFTQEEKGYSSDSKEAIAFVILGNQTFHRQTSNLPSVTGAKKTVILGQITY